MWALDKQLARWYNLKVKQMFHKTKQPVILEKERMQR